jgi:hypothetical protein
LLTPTVVNPDLSLQALVQPRDITLLVHDDTLRDTQKREHVLSAMRLLERGALDMKSPSRWGLVVFRGQDVTIQSPAGQPLTERNSADSVKEIHEAFALIRPGSEPRLDRQYEGVSSWLFKWETRRTGQSLSRAVAAMKGAHRKILVVFAPADEGVHEEGAFDTAEHLRTTQV